MNSANNSTSSSHGVEATTEEIHEDITVDSKPDSNATMEYEIICNMTSFLEANCAEDVDKKVLRNMAVNLAKCLNDTSPGTLQDVTMDNPYGVGYRSPCASLQAYQGSTSPAGQGRSVREFEEQMASLRKENFNLKLRLYFIEESIPGYKQANSAAEDTLMKQLIDSKVEMAIIRKEVQEKQDLLKEAAQAMNHMEKIQKETEQKYQNVVDELNHKIQYLEMERDMEKSRFPNAGSGDLMNELLERSDVGENLNALQKIHELDRLLKQSDDKLMDFQQQINSLEEMISKRDETIKEYEDKVKELVFQNAELLESIENKDKEIANNEAQQWHEEMQKLKIDVADKNCKLQDLEIQLQNRSQQYENGLIALKKMSAKIKNMERGHSKTADPNANESDEQSDESDNDCIQYCCSELDSLNPHSVLQRHQYEYIIERHEMTIENLRAEVKKKTADLQNFVNKELWEKNREIERLNKMLNNVHISPVTSPANDTCQAQSQAAGELQQSFSEADYSKALKRNKLLQRKVDILMQRLGTERQNDSLVTQLKKELNQARLDAETAEKWRRQCADLCTTLSTRLEELAGFLNSLLKHKDVLGVLAVDKHKAMRRAVDRSLDLSKSLNMTLSVSGLSMIDQSLAELYNLSDILGDVNMDLENKTFNSNEDSHVMSIEVLKAENKALKKELDKRHNVDSKKERRSLPLPIMAENKESESEAWSEPDRKVSLARIGLEDHSTSLMAKEQPLADKNNDTDSDYSDPNNRSIKARLQERINHLEQQIQQRDNRILDIQCKLVDTDNRLKKENLKVIEANQELKQLKQDNEDLRNDLIAIGGQKIREIPNESLLLKQTDDTARELAKLQEEHERLSVESHLAEMQINSLKADMETIRQMYEEAIEHAATKEKQQLESHKQEMEETIKQKLLAKDQEHQECLQKDYVAINIYKECSRQLSDLQKQYVDAQRTIDCLQENERELKQTLVENELATRNLQKKIDEITLTASKAAMERVKAINEKLQFEKRVEELCAELNKHETENNQMQKQIEHLEQVQLTINQRLNGPQVNQPLSKNDDGCPSGYTSEEVPMPHSTSSFSLAKGDQNNVAQQRLGEQRTHNSSPDLGIESDAGRVSSVELNSVQRPQLKTVEICSTSNNDDHNDSSTENIKPSNAATDANINYQQLAKKHDCVKVEQENAELRRKLLRTKRAFEDTYEKLRNANQRKAQIEKDIKNQILKTHNVLKNVRSNMENEL